MQAKERKEKIAELRKDIGEKAGLVEAMTAEERKAYNDQMDALQGLLDVDDAEARAAKLAAAPRIEDVIPAKELRKFSVTAAIRDLAGQGRADREREISAELRKAMGVAETNGIMIPTSMRAATVGDNDGIVGTSVAEPAPALVFQTVLNKLGVSVLSGLVGNVEFPRQTQKIAGAAKAENAQADAVNAAFSIQEAKPHRIPVQTVISKQLLMQSSTDIEGFIRSEIERAQGEKIEYYALNGTGSSNQPTGLFNVEGVQSIANVSPSWTYANSISAKAAIRQYMANLGACKWLLSPEAYELIAVTPRDAGSGLFGLNDDTNTMAGHPFEVTGNISGKLMFGDWSSVVLASWGAVDMVADPYTMAATGQIVLTTTSFVDVIARQPGLLVKAANPINVDSSSSSSSN